MQGTTLGVIKGDTGCVDNASDEEPETRTLLIDYL